MNKQEVIKQLLDNGVFAVIRLADTNKLKKVIEALVKGGVKNIEVTMTVPNAVESIRTLSKEYTGDVVVGAGTILDLKNANALIDAGAKFLVSPFTNFEILKAMGANFPVIPGCFSPTEIMNAHNAGAEIIKVFPAAALGPSYFKDILAPLPFLKLMPTGGVLIDNVGEWVAAGACMVALGSNLLDKKAIEQENYGVITDLAKHLTNNFFEARKKKAGK
jgi:2-dehydro-3-deoxyphosphogluconate aldolase/(4S)-4-hydroxy-2-oxoglutarate aldolase